MFPKFENTLIGFDSLDDMFSRLNKVALKNVSFPPYNIRRVGDNKFLIEVALAGYDIADIDIDLENQMLKISSKGHAHDASSVIHQGFSYKAFERQFQLMQDIVVNTAEMTNGVLKVYLDRIVPEENKPKKIKIGVPAPTIESHPQLLNESSSI